MADIFLSYNRDDQAVARRFAEAFEAHGLSVWWDVTLRSGEAYDQVTEKALRDGEGRRRAVVEEVRRIAVGARGSDARRPQQDVGAGDDRAVRAADHVRADANRGALALAR